MITNSLVAALAAALLALSTVPYAQTAKSESSGPLTPERKCDALSGAKKEQCLRDARRLPDNTARRLPDNTARRPELRGSCDALIGPEKERCLKRGGTVEAGAKSP